MRSIGISNYQFAMDEGKQMASRGLQRQAFPPRALLGTNTYGGGTQFASRMIARGKSMQAFGIGRMGGEGDRPWWESLFGHIENMTTIAAPFVVQILDMSMDQQRAGWAQKSADEREKNYQAMIMSLAGQKTGNNQYQFSDPNARAFLLQQFRSEPASTQQSVLNSMTGGDAQMTSALQSLVSPWYMKLEVTLPLAIAGVAGIVGLAYAFSR